MPINGQSPSERSTEINLYLEKREREVCETRQSRRPFNKYINYLLISFIVARSSG
jgi:hypothetical protein